MEKNLRKYSLINNDKFLHYCHERNKNVLVQCEYKLLPVTAAIKRDYVTGLQFHPEKNGQSGLNILTTFLSK